MNNILTKNHIENEGNSRFDWTMSVDISVTYYDDDMDEFTNGCLYTDEQYGYYERVHTICSDHYCSTFRFDKERMKDVLLYLLDNSPLGFEHYLLSIEGCEIIEQDRY